MSRALLAYLILILLPAAGLAFFASSAAESDYRNKCAAARARIAEEADAYVRRLQSAYADAERKAETTFESIESSPEQRELASLDVPVGFVHAGQLAGYTPVPGAVADVADASIEEWHYYRLSVRGGESYEFARRDPERALDAYSFYLKRIRNQTLLDRLRLRAARAALAAGRIDLGRSVLESLVEQSAPSVSTTADGLPIDVVAAMRLHELAAQEASSPHAGRTSLAALVEKRHPSLSTCLLSHVAELLGSDGRDGRDSRVLRRVVEKRRSLENAVAAHPTVLESSRAALAGDALLIARALELPGAPEPLRVVGRVGLSRPPLGGGPFEMTLSRDITRIGEVGRDGDREDGTVERAVRLGRDGPILEKLVVSDPRFPGTLAALERDRNRQYGLIGMLVFATLAGGLALVFYLVKERRLATLRSRLLANVSHELKTPITSIRMFSEMLAHDELDDRRTRRFGELLLAESLRLSRIVTNLLDYSWFGSREAELKIEPVDLGGLLGRVAAAFSFHAEEKGVAFAATGLPTNGSSPVLVESNTAALERIVVNLLDNALKYRDASKDASRIELSLGQEGGAVQVAVRDNGIGVRRGDRERVFEEFYRARYEDYAVKGAGLGLAISRRLARKLGGDILLESRPASGSTFTLVVPVGPRGGNGTPTAVEESE